ncbi:hypothetical protein HanRHA438_Chr12g0552911 [Helianthus annuus]|uniref:Uncharacterized protein n=1 Tax=Helianthus annuus TaxID=4232 RepID=A0A251T247_HELAN|nr:hypothetical protein HanXRQr2_Chr12g0541881 [Helianthus annuus]KAJ0505308.1 hypothetical protein HanHA89_Chr12g0469101 [Helianthus annuus]KAJ0674985.1 hypothetical protein HanLR1_Chr12g0446111 [Helianthus annuus]KAJ0862726.1 hypothetical protein HanPSC8_Chr12g0521651 [Helianthus annuus]KAJ0866535.1 hypothetical protein HanRHA438_Chr12g0552911 [Helianthus annuus]
MVGEHLQPPLQPWWFPYFANSEPNCTIRDESKLLFLMQTLFSMITPLLFLTLILGVARTDCC